VSPGTPLPTVACFNSVEHRRRSAAGDRGGLVSDSRRHAVRGSEREPLAGARLVGPAPAEERIEVSVVVRRVPAGRDLPDAAELGALPAVAQPRVDREAFAAAHGATADELAKVEDFAHDHDLEVVEVSAARRTVVLAGTVAAMNAAFGVELGSYEYEEGTYRGRTGPVHIPADLADIVEGVFGLDDRPQARPHFRLGVTQGAFTPRAVGGVFTPPELAALYNFPAGADGSGECIAIIELGGGHRRADLKAYFGELGLPTPRVTAVSVDGGRNRPTGDPNSADAEVMLDIEVAGAVAPAARIAVYYAPNSDRGFLDALTTAVHDTHRKPSVVSISWGAPEVAWTDQAIHAFDQACQEAAVVGVTILCAAGDDGSNDRVGDNLAHTDFPASSPHVLACGGTRLEAAGGAISSEVVWNEPGGGATGGGVSDVFDLPPWQAAVGVPVSANPDHHQGRAVPDAAADADPQTGYLVRVDGQEFPIGGTSAVSPLFAGLLARVNQQLGRPVGFLTPLLYGKLAAAGVFNDIVVGSNGAYDAGPGYDACTGWGSIDGTKLAGNL